MTKHIALLFVVAACGSGTSSRLDGDAAIDTPPPTMPDAAPDAAPDATPDAAIDAAIDAAPDAAIDAMPDAMIDAMPDAAVQHGTLSITPEPTVSPADGPLISLPLSNPNLTLAARFFGSPAVEPFTVTLTGPFTITSQVPASTSAQYGTVAFNIAYTGTTFGHGTGDFSIQWDGFVTTYHLEVDIDPVITIALIGSGDVEYWPPAALSPRCAEVGYPNASLCFPVNTPVTFTAWPGDGYWFSHWTDVTCWAHTTCTLTANQTDDAVTAYFRAF
ncbi:MAG TPA: hypothetical protein VGM88_22055 [Kofleriaceae bacterium]|jgi:hypothetical protein